VYVSAWLKCHEPAAFACALLNSQPMGFYAPSQIVQDARRHGVEVRPVDVLASEWECTLEDLPSPQPSPRRGEGDDSSEAGWGEWDGRGGEGESCASLNPIPSPPRGEGQGEGPTVGAGDDQAKTTPRQTALRLGLRQVKGFSLEGVARLTAARAQGGFDSIEELASRSGMDPRDLKCLAAAGALAALAGHRRKAYWDVAGIERRMPLAMGRVEEAQPDLFPLTEGQDLVADYASLGLSLGRHPLALLRDRLQRERLVTAAELSRYPHGRLARAAGLVINRQRPGTAGGVTFLTLEDETGHVNVVVWRDLAERQRRELLGARLLAVYGTLERQGEVAHLIAGHLRDLTPLLGDLVTHSRDFH